MSLVFKLAKYHCNFYTLKITYTKIPGPMTPGAAALTAYTTTQDSNIPDSEPGNLVNLMLH